MQLQDEDTTMKHTPSTTPLRCAAGLLAVLTILMMSASFARGAAPSGMPPDHVYLPLVQNASSGTATPTPPPPSQVRMVLGQVWVDWP
jgi:hypothetical protein